MYLYTFAYNYLLVALPQSSSTSLMSSLGHATHLPAVQRTPCRYMKGMIRETNYRPLDTHSDTCNLPVDILRNWITSNTIYKQHVTPTQVNLQNIQSILENDTIQRGVVILDRVPLESVTSFCKRVMSENKTFTLRQMRNRYDSLSSWVKGWSDFNSSHIYRTNYRRLIQNFSLVVNNITTFWNVSSKASFKMYYSRYINQTHPVCQRYAMSLVRTSSYNQTNGHSRTSVRGP